MVALTITWVDDTGAKDSRQLEHDVLCFGLGTK